MDRRASPRRRLASPLYRGGTHSTPNNSVLPVPCPRLTKLSGGVSTGVMGSHSVG